jgi:hypothetical protein
MVGRAGAAPGIRQCQQQIALEGGPVAIARSEDGQRPLVVICRLLERELRQCAIARAAGVADRLAGVGDLRRVQPMMRQLVDARLRVRPGQLFQGFADAAVQPRPARRAQFIVQRRANQRVAEGEAINRTGELRDQRRGAGLVEGIQDRVFAAVGNARLQWQVELPSDHRRQVEYFVRLVRKAIQAAPDHVLDALRNAEGCDIALEGPPVPLLEDGARLAQMAQDLADEEGTAFGLVV